MNWKSEKQKEDLNYLFIWIIHVVCMLNTFDTLEMIFNKYTASYGVICVTLIKITF